ncbi:MAG: hypothetical protein GWP37_12025 [Gammaproteobacteria bacterium]|nr:hypothetical protein [Gammaproteobacteria bacterium]
MARDLHDSASHNLNRANARCDCLAGDGNIRLRVNRKSANT